MIYGFIADWKSLGINFGECIEICFQLEFSKWMVKKKMFAASSNNVRSTYMMRYKFIYLYINWMSRYQHLASRIGVWLKKQWNMHKPKFHFWGVWGRSCPTWWTQSQRCVYSVHRKSPSWHSIVGMHTNRSARSWFAQRILFDLKGAHDESCTIMVPEIHRLET